MTEFPLGQVVSLSDNRSASEVPKPGAVPGAGGAVLRDLLSGGPFDAASTGFVLACLPNDAGPVLWVQDRMSQRENGRPYGPALTGFGFRGQLLRVEVSHPRDVLWAMEEGAACGGLGAIVGEVHGAPEVLSFTATKRLSLRAEASKIPIWLLRSGDPGTLSAARERWRVSSKPSKPHQWDAQATGPAQWEAELFRARNRPPGTWIATYDPKARDDQDRLRLEPAKGAAADRGHVFVDPANVIAMKS